MYRELRNIFNIARLRNELGEIYFNQVIETFAVSLISVFIPIYLLDKGFSLMDTFSFMLVYWGSMFAFTPIASQISSRIGFKHAIIYRAPLLAVYFSLLFLVNYLSGFLFVIALIGGFSAILYWVATNAEFVRSADEINQAKQVGYLTALPQISTVIAPLIGALMLSVPSLGFPAVFLLVIVLIGVSQLPFLMTSDYREKFALKMRQSWMFLSRRSFAFFIIQGVIFTNEFLVWNLFVYSRFGVVSTGLAATFYGAGMAIFTIFVGKFSGSSTTRRSMLVYGSLGYTFTCIIRIFTQTQVEAFLISMLAGIFTTIISVPIYVDFVEQAKKKGILNWVTFRDFWLSAGRVLFVIALTIALLFSSPDIYYIGFEIAGMFSLLLLFLVK